MNYIKKYHMVDPGDRIVIGLSGGADSVCLLHLLWCLREELGIALFAVHVHHGLRGAEADRDAWFSEDFCRRLGVPCRVEYICAEQEAKEARISVEEAGRQARYRIFEAEARRIAVECAGGSIEGANQPGGANLPCGVKIATAHHGNDSAETILFHLFRGSGLKGLGGIAPVRGRVIRPILWAEREQIISYLSENGLSYVEDSTNADTDYTRNKIRNLILPTAVSEINRQAVQNILRAGEWIAGADRYLERQAARWLEEHGQPEEHAWPETHGQPEGPVQPEKASLSLPIPQLKAEEPLLQGYILRLALGKLGSPSRDITAVHIGDILSLLDKQTGKNVALPYGLCAAREYDRLCLTRRCAKIPTSVRGGRGSRDSHFPAQVQRIVPNAIPPEGLILTEGPLPGLRFEVFPCENPCEFPKNQYTKWFDYDKIKDTLSVRYRCSGDYIMLPTGGRKTLKAFFVDEKIPRQKRGEIPLLAEGSHVLWIVGLRISEYYKITEHTKMVLKVQLDGGASGG